MRIDQPYYFLLLLLLPLAVWIFLRFMNWRNSAVLRWANASLIEKLAPGISNARPKIKFIALMIAAVCMIAALTNFQFPSAEKNEKRHGVDVAIVLDASSSMQARDADSNRLGEAKQFATELLTTSADNRFSLVAFARTAIIMVPLTPDHAAAEMILNSINANTIPEQGSDIGAAILEGIKSLPNNQNHFKAMVLITDGEDHEGKISDALKLAISSGITIFTVGIGTTRGSEIPLTSAGFSSAVKKDAEGKVVITKLNSETLTEIAKKTGGDYFHYTSSSRDVPSAITKQIAAFGSNEYNQKILSGYESEFQFFLFPALLLLIFELFIRNRKVK
ncbi:MAG: VWA domain-containing protein [Chitinophagales bacterium]